MLKQKLQSELLFEQMNGVISKEESVKISKENIFNEVRAYLGHFQSSLFNKLNTLTEEQLVEIAYATKFFCRIKEQTEGEQLSGINNQNSLKSYL